MRREGGGRGTGRGRDGERERGGGEREEERGAESPEAKGRVQALPLRGDRETGGALDNQHAEMVRSFQQPFVFPSRLCFGLVWLINGAVTQAAPLAVRRASAFK